MKLPFTLIGVLCIVCTSISVTRGVTVDDVYFESGTIWAEASPRVMCAVTEEPGEEVVEVLWTRYEELVYRWAYNQSVEVYGVLEDRVEVPSNESDWNIQVTRLHMDIEGEFTCTAVTNLNTSHSNSFQFVVFYYSVKTINTYTSDELCTAGADFSYLAVYPEPLIMICVMEHNDYELSLNGTSTISTNQDGSFKYSYNVTSVEFSMYPEGSYMRCYNYVRGGEVEHLKWQPHERASCPDPPAAWPGFSSNVSHLTPGCRGGHQADSLVVYVCDKNEIITAETECDFSGKWIPDLSVQENWPVCAGNELSTSAFLLIMVINIVMSGFYNI